MPLFMIWCCAFIIGLITDSMLRFVFLCFSMSFYIQTLMCFELNLISSQKHTETDQRLARSVWASGSTQSWGRRPGTVQTPLWCSWTWSHSTVCSCSSYLKHSTTTTQYSTNTYIAILYKNFPINCNTIQCHFNSNSCSCTPLNIKYEWKLSITAKRTHKWINS